MPPEFFDFFDPTPEQQKVVLVDATTLHEAEKLLECCEGCNPDGERKFRSIRDRVTGSDPSVTDYSLAAPVQVPQLQTEDAGKDSR
jgi:hypothetical protein